MSKCKNTLVFPHYMSFDVVCSKFPLCCVMQMTVAEAREVCQCGWMKEALDELVNRQLKPQEANETTCT